MAVLDCNFIAQEFMVISVISSYGYNHWKWESSSIHEIVEKIVKMWFLSSRPKSSRSTKEVKNRASYFFCINCVIKMSRIILIKYLHDVVASNIQQI